MSVAKKDWRIYDCLSIISWSTLCLTMIATYVIRQIMVTLLNFRLVLWSSVQVSQRIKH